MIDEGAIAGRYEAVRDQLRERGRRLFVASEARAAGRGGVAAASRATGVARSTIGRGLKDLPIKDLGGPGLAPGRVRRAGSGRRALIEKDPCLLEDLRRFQHHMRTNGASAGNMNMAVSALRFFFGVCLGRGDAEVGMTTVRLPQRLPVILSPAEVARLLDVAPGLKARAALSLAYGAGLRASEVVSLKVTDIDSGRQVIRVEQGKSRFISVPSV